MDQETSNEIAKDAAIFILENLPLQSEFGIDCKSYQIGEKFKGLKMIPKGKILKLLNVYFRNTNNYTHLLQLINPGIHFIYFSVMSKDGQLSPRTGFFHYFECKETLIKEFDIVNEDLSTESLTSELINKYRIHNLPYFDSHLGPYPFEQYKQWISLTDFIDLTLTERLNSESKSIRSVSAIVPKVFRSNRNQMETDEEANDLNDLNFKIDSKHQLKFTSINQLNAYPTNSSPEQITKYKIDNSFLLEQIINNYDKDTGKVLGELQLAFIVFFIGQNYEAFEQWKHLFRLICKSSSAMIDQNEFFINFIRVIYFQLKEVPSDIFVDILENNNFLICCLRDFFLNVYNQEDKLNVNLIQKCKKFQQYLSKQYEWEFDVEPDDEAPVVVDLND